MYNLLDAIRKPIEQLAPLLKQLEDHPELKKLVFDYHWMSPHAKEYLQQLNAGLEIFYYVSPKSQVLDTLSPEFLVLKKKIDKLAAEGLLVPQSKLSSLVERPMKEIGYPVCEFFSPEFGGASFGARIKLKEGDYIVFPQHL